MYLSHNIVKQVVKLELSIKELDQQEKYSKRDKNNSAQTNQTNILFFLINFLGINIQLKEAEKLFGDKQIITKDFRGQLVENMKATLDLCSQIAANSELNINSGLLLEINKSLAQKTVEDWQLNYRAAGEQFMLVYEDYATAIDPIKQLPQGLGESYSSIVSKLLENFNEFNDENRFYKLSQFCFELLSVHPFIAYNNFTTVFIAYAMLGRMVGPSNNVVNIAELLTQKREELLHILKQTDPQQREIAWHEMFLGYIASEYDKRITALSEAGEATTSNKPFLDLNRRQLKILKYLQTIPTVKREDYVQMMNISAMTAYRDLQLLVKHKLIKPMGVGRGTKYTLYSR